MPDSQLLRIRAAGLRIPAGWEIFHVTWRDLPDMAGLVRQVAAALDRRRSILQRQTPDHGR